MSYTIFPSLNFMCNQQSRQEKQASLTHTRENADLSILLITPNLKDNKQQKEKKNLENSLHALLSHFADQRERAPTEDPEPSAPEAPSGQEKRLQRGELGR